PMVRPFPLSPSPRSLSLPQRERPCTMRPSGAGSSHIVIHDPHHRPSSEPWNTRASFLRALVSELVESPPSERSGRFSECPACSSCLTHHGLPYCAILSTSNFTRSLL